jgi:hypothetical protein
MTLELGIFICLAVITLILLAGFICLVVFFVRIKNIIKQTEYLVYSIRYKAERVSRIGSLMGSIFNLFRASRKK